MSLQVNIKRVEIVVITNAREILEENNFDNWADAFEYLEHHLQQKLSSFHRKSFMDNPFTATSPINQMVSKGSSAYSARVFYAVEVVV